jgi:hypothetical protein
MPSTKCNQTSFLSHFLLISSPWRESSVSHPLYPTKHHAGAANSSGPSSTHRARAISTARTYPTRSADVGDGDIGAPGMVQQLEEFM